MKIICKEFRILNYILKSNMIATTELRHLHDCVCETRYDICDFRSTTLSHSGKRRDNCIGGRVISAQDWIAVADAVGATVKVNLAEACVVRVSAERTEAGVSLELLRDGARVCSGTSPEGIACALPEGSYELLFAALEEAAATPCSAFLAVIRVDPVALLPPGDCAPPPASSEFMDGSWLSLNDDLRLPVSLTAPPGPQAVLRIPFPVQGSGMGL